MILLDQLTQAVQEICPNADPMQVRMKIAGVLSLYEIKPGRGLGGHPDIAEKTKMFLSAKKLEV